MSRVFGFDLLREQVAEMAAAEVDFRASFWKYGDTPIERLFSLALLSCAAAKQFEWDARPMVWLLDAGEIETFSEHPEAKKHILVQKQVDVGQWRVDFLIQRYHWSPPAYDNGEWRHLIVECDGHDYHERTKEQAARDRSRDRRATMNNIPVLRYTGSELWNDPRGCVTEVLQALERIGGAA